MRVLRKAECSFVGGGGATAPAAAPLTRQSPTVYTNSFNGITTTVVCTTPFSINLSLGVTTKGKLVDMNTGLSVNTENCTTYTTDTKTQIESICKGTDCTVINLKTGQKISETTVDNGDTGVEQLASGDGGDAAAFSEYDFAGDPGYGDPSSGYGDPYSNPGSDPVGLPEDVGYA